MSTSLPLSPGQVQTLSPVPESHRSVRNLVGHDGVWSVSRLFEPFRIIRQTSDTSTTALKLRAIRCVHSR